MSLLVQAVQENKKVDDELIEAHRPLVKRIAKPPCGKDACQCAD